MWSGCYPAVVGSKFFCSSGALLLNYGRTVLEGYEIKFTPEQATKAQRGVEVSLYSFFNIGTKWGWVVNDKPQPLYPRERPGTHCIGGWVGPMTGLDGSGKSRPPPGFDPQTIQPLASRSTD
jgi:hypothetical protein